MPVVLRVKDANGVWRNIPAIKGADGADGKDGAPGADGKDGAPGADGKDGAPGADGYTPVKGVDYYTEADKQEIVDLVLDALPNGDEVSY